MLGTSAFFAFKGAGLVSPWTELAFGLDSAIFKGGTPMKRLGWEIGKPKSPVELNWFSFMVS